MRVIIEGRGVRGAAWRARQGESDLTTLKRGILVWPLLGLLPEKIGRDQVRPYSG